MQFRGLAATGRAPKDDSPTFREPGKMVIFPSSGTLRSEPLHDLRRPSSGITRKSVDPPTCRVLELGGLQDCVASLGRNPDDWVCSRANMKCGRGTAVWNSLELVKGMFRVRCRAQV